MLRRDLILLEIQKLMRDLAKISSLKLEGKTEEAHDLATVTFCEELNLQKQELNNISPADFKSYLIEKNFPAEKLDMLSKIMFENASSLATSEYYHRLKLVLVIYDILEKVHHIQSLSNISRRSAIEGSLETEDL